MPTCPKGKWLKKLNVKACPAAIPEPFVTPSHPQFPPQINI